MMIPLFGWVLGCQPQHAAFDNDDDDDDDDDVDEPCADRDGDDICNADDNCPDDRNQLQGDVDGDGVGDVCEPTSFTFRLVAANVAPVKANQQPWDWTGDVPNHLVTAFELVGLFYPKAATFADVLEFVDEEAPELLEGTVPPDPYAWIVVLGDENDLLLDLGYTVEDQNTYDPHWGDRVIYDAYPDESLCVFMYDSDLVDDDAIGGVCFDLPILQEAESRGPLEYMVLYDGIWSIVVEVEPIG